MAIPPWAVEVMRRSVGGMMEKVPPDAIDQLRKRASDLLGEIPHAAAKGVDSVMRGAKAGKTSLHRWSRRHVALVTPVVNASGCLCNPKIAGVPIGIDAIDVATEAFQSGALTTSVARQRLDKRVAKTIPGGDFAVLMTSTLDGACLGIAEAFSGDAIYCHRSQSQRLPSGIPVPEAFHANHEIGSIDGFHDDDARHIPQRCLVVGLDDGKPGPWFASIDKTKSITRVMVLPVATLRNAIESALPPLPSIFATLEHSADLVVVPGDGSMGGPRCGLIIGKQSLLDRIVATSVWPAIVADVSVQAAMAVTLEATASGDLDSVPVLSMLATSPENLRSRAERLATRLAAEPIIRSCDLTDSAATLSAAGPWSLPSRQLKLTHRDLSAASWAEKLAGDVPAIIVNVKDDAILVDLRWIQPVDDSAIVVTLVGSPTELPVMPHSR